MCFPRKKYDEVQKSKKTAMPYNYLWFMQPDSGLLLEVATPPKLVPNFSSRFGIIPQFSGVVSTLSFPVFLPAVEELR
jgi:hypothetical protein